MIRIPPQTSEAIDTLCASLPQDLTDAIRVVYAATEDDEILQAGKYLQGAIAKNVRQVIYHKDQAA